MFLKEEPQSTGTSWLARQAARRARRSSSGLISSPSRYLAISSSSNSTMASIISCRANSTSSRMASGISVDSARVPRSSR